MRPGCVRLYDYATIGYDGDLGVQVMELQAMVYQLRRRPKGKPKANDLAPPCHIEPPICVATTDLNTISQWGRRRFTRVEPISWRAA